ncbi:hypothetical protein F5I97DRAFT_1895012 [Phlebopus sp. FC_14]|nr:hypothetical protein F5I97DRAFT_1895012 [Phlebopus sp. FC_14]
MAFCRRCGEIVVGTRCKCGGTAVAPVLKWAISKGEATDKWSQIYVSRERSPTRLSGQVASTGFHSAAQSSSSNANMEKASLLSSTYHLPPHSSFHSSNSPTSSRTDIISHVSSLAPPLKPLDSTPASPTTLAAETGFIQAPDTPDLSNAYGSVLQPKETLATYSCTVCSTEFQPDTTVYPDPLSPMSHDRFMCRHCFSTNGGSKGDCPTCYRPVLILKSEGGFVEASGRVWHKNCFTCVGCRKNIGETPMVDLLGQPSCPNCFDNCLKRTATPQRSNVSRAINKADKRLSDAAPADMICGEGGPAIDEPEHRLDFMRNGHGSPVLEELTQRLNAVLNRTPRDACALMTSPLCRLYSDNRDNSAIHRTPGKIEATSSPPRNQSSDLYDVAARTSDAGADSRSNTPSRRIHENFVTPERGRTSSFGRPSPDAIEEMKRRFMRQLTEEPASLVQSSLSPDPLSPSFNMISATSTPSRIPKMSRPSGSPALRHAMSTSSLRSSRTSLIPSTQDLIPDMCDTLTQDSTTSSSSQVNPGAITTVLKEQTSHAKPPHVHGVSLPRPATQKPRDSPGRLSVPAATLSPGSLCAKCGGSLFAKGGSGRFVTVPEFNIAGPPKTYHSECFRCVMCDGPFKESSSGQAVFVRGEGGAYHMECAPSERTYVKSTAASSPMKSEFSDSPLTPPLLPVTNTIQTAPTKTATTVTSHTRLKDSPSAKANICSSRYEHPPPSAPAASAPYSRFGSSAACPGCSKSVSPMEFGVVPGPQGSRWHATCLVCGGKGASKVRREKSSQPGCGKKLDSAAKRATDGGVWCRECLLLLPSHLRNPPVDSAAKPLLPSLTGRSAGGSFVAPQFTGTTTIARQFTGRGGDAMIRQLTGGSVSPSRQRSVSPTKQFGLATPRPRPKSVIGLRSGKSVDEGRGMFLVRQMTGGGSFGI